MRPVLLAALALLLVAPGAAAVTEDVAWRGERRSTAMAATGPGFSYTSTRDSDLGSDTLSGAFDAAAARLDARLSAREPEAAEATLTMTWSSLAEYRDADGDGAFGLADPLVQRVAIPGLPAGTVVTPLLAGGHAATVTYTLPANESGLLQERGRLRLTFTLVPDEVALAGGARASPADLGLAAEVEGFPFRARDTRLALVSDVAATQALGPAAGGVGLTLGALTFRAAWLGTASVDGVPVPAPATSVSDRADQASLVQSWPQGSRVEQRGAVMAQRWDAGALLEALPPGDWRFYALGVAAVAVALGVPSWRRLREP